MGRTKRHNESVEAEFYNASLSKPFAEGGFHKAAKGKFTEGHRKGQKAVCKWFKSGHVHEEKFFKDDIRAMEMSVDLIAKWNKAKIIEQIVRVNVPEVWTFSTSDFFEKDTKVLVEPFIENYRKFNSNTGWNDTSTPWPMVMQALSHFTYHVSNGKYLVCDLQGGIDSKTVVLTDPAVLSRKKEFGPMDLGPKGISTFFNRHKCNRFCGLHWLKPQDRTKYYQPQQGTSMSGSATMAPPPPRFCHRSSGRVPSFSRNSSLPLIEESSMLSISGVATCFPPPPRFARRKEDDPIFRRGHKKKSITTSTSSTGITTIVPPPPPPPPRITRNQADYGIFNLSFKKQKSNGSFSFSVSELSPPSPKKRNASGWHSP
eukprot:CAMPEP_0178736306 /NCGR_PEP_ID=MMETSP0744-20121128/2366_1 /TAXON_ID=913974 /ORGANISM="Nitzschia punctata, Strain CCMP561" /LENGTH=371 /DNA_ID=CAMNT_0020388763 /DNA_START=335 /DNA_END=1450 /DNA_ORIENTATION=+